MALYTDLTNEEKQDIASYDTFMRGMSSQLTQARMKADPEKWNQFATDNVDPPKSTLDPGEMIPNSTGLAGAKDLTIEEYNTLQQILRDLETTYQNNKALLVKAAGINAD